MASDRGADSHSDTLGCKHISILNCCLVHKHILQSDTSLSNLLLLRGSLQHNGATRGLKSPHFFQVRVVESPVSRSLVFVDVSLALSRRPPHPCTRSGSFPAREVTLHFPRISVLCHESAHLCPCRCLSLQVVGSQRPWGNGSMYLFRALPAQALWVTAWPPRQLPRQAEEPDFYVQGRVITMVKLYRITRALPPSTVLKHSAVKMNFIPDCYTIMSV